MKDDDFTFRSDNIGLEFECRGKDSGIAVTEANYWIHKVRGIFYCFKVSVLLEKIKDKQYDWINDCAGDAYSFTHLYIIKQDKFIKWGRPLKEK